MPSIYNFNDITLDEYRSMAEMKCGGAWRYVQSFCTQTDEGIDFTVTFCKDGVMDNVRIRSIQKSDTVPSISDLYFSAFVFENEAHDLFGLNISDIVIDFKGNFYDLAQSEPMTIVSPEFKAAREKAAKVAAAKAAKIAKAKADAKADAEAKRNASASTDANTNSVTKEKDDSAENKTSEVTTNTEESAGE